METLNLLIISSVGTSTPPKSYGGLEWIAYLIAKGMHKRGHRVTIVGSYESSKEAYPEGIRLIRTVYSHMTPIPELDSFKIWKKKLENEIGNFDIIHDNSHSQFSVIFQKRMEQLRQPFPKVIRTIHDDCPFQTPPPLQFPNLVGVSLTHSIRLANSLYGIVTRTVYHGIPLQNYYFSETKSNRFLFFGRIQPIKGVHIALEIAKQLDLELDIAGPDTHIPNFLYPKRIKSLCDGKKIKYHGQITEIQKRNLLKNAKACIFPSQFHEPFGLMVIEAQASGTPCIVSSLGGLSETTIHEKTGFICYSIKEMIDAVQRIDEIKPKDCLERSKYFSEDRMIENYIKLYKDILDGKEW